MASSPRSAAPNAFKQMLLNPGARQGSGQVRFDRNPATSGYDQALANYTYQQQLAARRNAETNRLRGSTTSRAPTVLPRTLSLSPAHDWSDFDKSFPGGVERSSGVANPPPVGPQDFARSAVAASPAPYRVSDSSRALLHLPPREPDLRDYYASHPAGPATPGSPAAPLAAQVPAPPNPGAVARASGQQQDTKYGTVGAATPGTSNGTPIMENGVQVGVQGGPAFDRAAAQQRTLAAYPNVGVDKSPENVAFVNHYKQYGEQSAHENLDKIMAPIVAQRANPAGAQTMSLDASPEYQASMEQLARQNKNGLTPGHTPGQSGIAAQAAAANPSIPRAIGGAVHSAGTTVADTAGNIGGGIRDSLGSAWGAMKDLYGGITGKDDVPNYASGAAPFAANYGMLPDHTPVARIPGGNGQNYGAEDFTGSNVIAAQTSDPSMQLQLNNSAEGLAQQMPGAVHQLRRNTFDSEAHGAGGLGAGFRGGSTRYGAPMVDSVLAGASMFDSPPNFAGGLAPAIAREKKAISNGVGGARPGDKPVVTNLAGQPAVVNTGEKVINGANGVAVLNRKMLRMSKGKR